MKSLTSRKQSDVGSSLGVEDSSKYYHVKEANSVAGFLINLFGINERAYYLGISAECKKEIEKTLDCYAIPEKKLFGAYWVFEKPGDGSVIVQKVGVSGSGPQRLSGEEAIIPFLVRYHSKDLSWAKNFERYSQ